MKTIFVLEHQVGAAQGGSGQKWLEALEMRIKGNDALRTSNHCVLPNLTEEQHTT